MTQIAILIGTAVATVLVSVAWSFDVAGPIGSVTGMRPADFSTAGSLATGPGAPPCAAGQFDFSDVTGCNLIQYMALLK